MVVVWMRLAVCKGCWRFVKAADSWWLAVWEVGWWWLQAVVVIFDFLGLSLMQQSFWFSILSPKAWFCILSTIFRCPNFSISFKSCILSDAQLSHLAFWHSILRSFSSSTISSWLGPSYNSKESIVIHKVH